MSNLATQQSGEVLKLTGMIKMMANAIEQGNSVATQALNLANRTNEEFTGFKESVADVIERQNRIDSNQIRIIRRTVESRIRHLVGDDKDIRRKYFSRCYRSVHDACLTNCITDIPQKLYEHALKAAREWEPNECQN